MIIRAALEDWDDRINYFLPNTSDKRWFENQSYLRTLGDYLTNDYMEKGAIPKNVTPEYKNVVYKHKDNFIGKGGQYVYIVSILNVLYFSDNHDDGFKYVDQGILEDVRRGMCDIIFIQDTEGMSGMYGTRTENDFLTIQKWCVQDRIPFDRVHYICGNLLSDKVAKRQGCQYNVIPVTVQDIWINIGDYPDEIMEFNPTDGKYLYLNYSRRPRYHRVFFYSLLLKEGIFEIGTNSFNDMGWPIPFGQLKVSDPDIGEYAQKLFDMCPITIDRENASDDITLYMNLNDYERTFISVVTETLYEDGTLFNSEKIWKPIIMGHPFIILGNRSHLKWLKDQGFKTFDKWIDESYDQEYRMEDRSKKIVSELKRLSELPIEELKIIREEMKPICRFNKDLMMERVKNRFHTENKFYRLLPTSEEIRKIYSQRVQNKRII